VLLGTHEVAERYGVGEVLPVTIFVDREDIIRDKSLGILEPEELEKVTGRLR
jgi:hypothetical protein